MPAEVGKRLTLNDWKGAVARAMEDGLHLHLRDATQTVRASLADAALAQALDTPIGSALAAIDRKVMGADGRDRAQSTWAIKGKRR